MPVRGGAGRTGGLARGGDADTIDGVLGALLLAVGIAPEPSVFDRMDLRWQAPEGCPTEQEVRRRLADYLGREHYGEEVAAVRVRAKILAPRKGGGPYRLRMVVLLPVGEVQREVEGGDCGRFAGAAALIVAVALDPLRAEARVRVDPVPEAARDFPSGPPSRRVRRTQAEVRAGGGVLAAVVGGGTGVAALEVAMVRRLLRAAVVGRYLTPRTSHPFPSHPEAGVRVMGGSASVRLCFVPAVFRVEFPLCADLEAGGLRARGVGLPEVRTSRRPLVALGIGPEVVWHGRKGVGVFLAVDGAVWVLRPQFEAEGLGRAFLAGPAALRVVGGVSARF